MLEEEEATEPSQSSHSSEQAKGRRVAEWVDTTLGQEGQQLEVDDKPLNPLAPEFHVSARPAGKDTQSMKWLHLMETS